MTLAGRLSCPDLHFTSNAVSASQHEREEMDTWLPP